MISKDKLNFDTTDAQTILDSDSVGAFVRAKDGTLITKTTVGAKDGLDVNIINADLDIRDLVAATDSVSAYLKDGAGTSISSTLVSGKQSLDVNVTSGINVEVDLSHIDDSVRLGDGTNFLTSTTVGADIGLDVNLINASIVITATDLDIRDLVANSDSISSWTKDGAGTSITSTLDGAKQALDVHIANSITVSDAALANTAIATAANPLGVANTAEAVVASPLASRKYLMIYNDGNKKVYVGASGVSAATGFPLSPGSVLELRAGAAVGVEWVSVDTTQKIRTMELA